MKNVFGRRCAVAIRPGTILALGLVLGASAGCRREGARISSGDDPLDRAWTLAASITNDAKDRALCQERIARAWIRRGEAKRALELAADMESWRKGVVLAEAAAALAGEGRMAEAREALDRAAAVAASATDWPADRLGVHLAEACAAMGLADAVEAAAERYGQLPEYIGRVEAFRAAALAATGGVERAREGLDRLEADTRFDVLLWRSRGYLQLAGHGASPTGAAARALIESADRAAATLPDWSRWELQIEISGAWIDAGDAERARRRLEDTTTEALALRLPGHIRAPILARLAAVWGRLGEPDRVTALESAAAPMMETDLQSIEAPAVVAGFAEAYAAAGRTETAADRYAKAIALAGALRNPRPRAMALVDICLSLDRAGFAVPSILQALRRIGENQHASTN